MVVAIVVVPVVQLLAALKVGQAVANIQMATIDPGLRNMIKKSADNLEAKKEELSLVMLQYELERIFTYLMGETKNNKGYIPLQDRLNVAEFGLLESQVEAMSTQEKDTDVLQVVSDQVTDLKRRLGIDYYVTGLSFDREGGRVSHRRQARSHATHFVLHPPRHRRQHVDHGAVCQEQARTGLLRQGLPALLERHCLLFVSRAASTTGLHTQASGSEDTQVRQSEEPSEGDRRNHAEWLAGQCRAPYSLVVMFCLCMSFSSKLVPALLFHSPPTDEHSRMSSTLSRS